ncbi:MAG: transposase, partial [Faecousia sp.]
MHLNIVKSKNAQQFYVLEGYRNEDGKCTTRIVKKLGTYEQLAKEHDDPVAWAKDVVAEMNRQAKEGQQEIIVPFSPAAIIEKDRQNLFNG